MRHCRHIRLPLLRGDIRHDRPTDSSLFSLGKKLLFASLENDVVVGHEKEGTVKTLSDEVGELEAIVHLDPGSKGRLVCL